MTEFETILMMLLIPLYGIMFYVAGRMNLFELLYRGKVMDDKTIFVVTVFEKCEQNDRWFADIGCSRSPCFRYTFEEAEEVVKYNMCDIWETCYDYAVIHEIGCELYPHHHMRKFYKYNEDIDGYEPIEEPECLKHMDFCGIG